MAYGWQLEVASLRESQARGASEAGPTRDGYHAINVPIISLVVEAYVPTASSDLYYEYPRILGVPDWAKTDNYALEARVGESDLSAWQDPNQQRKMLRSMMQALLADRCKLVVHREMKELTYFALVPTKSGPKLKQTPSTDLADLKLKHPGGITLPDGGILISGNGTMSFWGVSMATLSGMLSVPAGHSVQDKTGLSDRYDFTLQLRDVGAGAGGESTDPLLSIFTVMPEQLGLHLQSKKGQVEVLVIDHIERPSEN